MPRLSKSDERRREVEFWQGGRPARSAVQRSLAELQRTYAADIAEMVGIQRKAARYLSQLQTPVKPAQGRAAEKALKGLRGIIKGLPKQKSAPKKLIPSPPPVVGEYTVVFTPEQYATIGLGQYALGQVTSETGNPTISTTGNETLGQMTSIIETSSTGASGGSCNNLFGIFFQPRFPSATAVVSFDSEISLFWYARSIQKKEANVSVQCLVQLYEYTGAFLQPPLKKAALINVSEVAVDTYDYGSFYGPGSPSSFTLPVVYNPEFFYSLVVSLTCTASGSGWPGSLAGLVAVVTVPSITVNITSNNPPPVR